jgi:wyosine [tRNA(Phe)-imidazoG37] synthetase (radical SAM superfamily)
MRRIRREFYAPATILKQVEEKIHRVEELGQSIDCLTFVPDGEPTLDSQLGVEIEQLKTLGIKVAVISNASLMGQKEVQQDLMNADWVSLKLDTIRPGVWRRINRPHRALKRTAILDGMLQFAKSFRGELVTEIMLVRGVNNDSEQIREIADFLTLLNPALVYLAIPTRPPAEKWVQPPGGKDINRAFQILVQSGNSVELLIGYEGNAFASTGNIREDLLSITAVHPMRKDAVEELLAGAGADWPIIDSLVSQGELIKIEYGGRTFYMKNLRK